MVVRFLADAVAVVHGAFLLYVALGGFLAWRWPASTWWHVAAVAWGAGIVAIGWDCPLTGLEEWLAERGGEDLPPGGFVDRYVEDVVWPERFTPWVQALAACAIVASWAGVVLRRPTSRAGKDPRVTI